MHRRLFLGGSIAGMLVGKASAATRQSRAEPAVDAAMLLSALQLLVEEQFAGVLHTLKLLASLSQGQFSKWSTAQPVLTVMSRDSPLLSDIWLADAQGAYRSLSRNWQPAPFTMKGPEFRRVLAGADAPGSLFVSNTYLQRSILVGTPVRNGAEVSGVWGASVPARSVIDVLGRSCTLPKGIYLTAVDKRTGRVALHSRPELIFSSVLGGDGKVAKAFAQARTQTTGQVRYDYRGSSRTAFFSDSAQLDWTFALVVPEAGAL